MLTGPRFLLIYWDALNDLFTCQNVFAADSIAFREQLSPCGNRMWWQMDLSLMEHLAYCLVFFFMFSFPGVIRYLLPLTEDAPSACSPINDFSVPTLNSFFFFFSLHNTLWGLNPSVKGSTIYLNAKRMIKFFQIMFPPVFKALCEAAQQTAEKCMI